MDTRTAGVGTTRAEQRLFTTTLRGNAALQKRKREDVAALANSTVKTVSARYDEDDVVLVKLRGALQESKLAMEGQARTARHWRDKLRRLRRRIKRTRWTRTTFHERARLQEEADALAATIMKAEVVTPHQQQRRQQRFDHLQELWEETGGSGRVVRNPNSEWAVAMHGGILARKKEERSSKRHEELDAKKLLAWSALHSLDDSGVMLSNSDICPRCYKNMMVTTDGKLFCPTCIVFFDNSMAASTMILDAGNTVRRGSSRRGHSTPYQSVSHFLDRLKNIMGVWRNIPRHVYRSVVMYLHKHNVPEHDHSTLWVGREALAATDNHEYYHNVHLILSHISGVQPPQIPPVLQSEFSILIRMIHSKWKEIQRLLDDEKARQDKMAGRQVRRYKRNNPNVGYCFDFIAVLRGHPELTRWNWAIHDPANVRLKDAIMEMVCRVFNWEFTPTKPKRLAGDAGAAVDRRQIAGNLADSILDDHDWRPRTTAEAAAKDKRRPTRNSRHKKKGPARKDCRGINFHAAQRLGKEVWDGVTFVVRTILNWRLLLSEFNPWEEIPDNIARVEALAIKDRGVHNIRQFITREREMSKVETLSTSRGERRRRAAGGRVRTKKKKKPARGKKREREETV